MYNNFRQGAPLSQRNQGKREEKHARRRKNPGSAAHPERVESLCRPLDREALQRLFLSLAREVPAGGRAAFLHDLTGLLAGRTTGEPAPVRDTIKRIEVLGRQMARRAEAMEDGSYWGEYDDGEITTTTRPF